ncbi:hypothetical protein FHS24_002437 [Psychrobacter luti]|uniref:DUF4365 domain-containing protein n=1 Tax=Psychrobacter luti TaxID=198481 RepID=A0A839TKB5_9GAMM|nr:hypothetical protein [Psychrobacter luti]MBB3107903.1 hypothetical protein [Psychrobacter luti]
MSKHFEHSSFREKLIEHLFIGEMLKLSWLKDDCQLEIIKTEVDNAGCDVVLEDNNIIRHIQLKTSKLGAKASGQKVNVRLATKPSGCIVWIVFDENTLELCSFYFFGAEAGRPLTGLENAKVAKHTKANVDGLKAERSNIRILNKGQFTRYDSIEDLYKVLFFPQN